jgi:hypothetical protein
VLAWSATAAAQEPVDRAMIARIRAEGLERSQVWSMFDTLVNVHGPRLTATPQYLAAATWARNKLASWRLDQPRFGRGWELQDMTLEMTEPRYMPLIGYPQAWSASTPGEVVAAPVWLAGKTSAEVQAMAPSLKGAIVMTQPVITSFIREDRVQPSESEASAAAAAAAATAAAARQGGAGGRGGGGRGDAGRGGGGRGDAGRGGGRGGGEPSVASVIRDAGAAVELRRSGGQHGTLFVLGGNRTGQAVPAIVIASEQYNMIARMIEHRVPVKLRVNLRTRYLTADTNGYNVIAEIPGTDPALRDQVVMVGGHLDSWHSSPGATDNADGSAIVLEVARILRAVGAQPRRTIRFALWAGEEEGLLGATQWVQRNLAGDANAAARSKFSVYFNIDPGTGPIYGWFLQGNNAVAPIFDAWLEPFKDIGARRNIAASIGNTDHLRFTAVGVPGFNPVQDYVDYDVRTHHTNVDTFERVKPEDLRQASVILASFVYHAAMRQELLPRITP